MRPVTDQGSQRVRRDGRRLAVSVSVLLALTLPPFAGPAGAAFEISTIDARSAALLTPGMVIEAVDGSGASATPADTTASGAQWGWRTTISAGELYGVSEAAVWGARASARVGAVSLGIELSRLGGALYGERSAAASVAYEPEPDLCLAVRARGLGIAARDVDDVWTGAVDACVTRRLLGRVHIVAAAENITRSRIGDSPVSARAGFGATLALPSLSLRWVLLLEDTFEPSSVLGFEAALNDWLRVRAGARDSPGRLGFGFGAGRNRGPWPTVDVAVQWHPQLGVSSFVSVTIEP